MGVKIANIISLLFLKNDQPLVPLTINRTMYRSMDIKMKHTYMDVRAFEDLRGKALHFLVSLIQNAHAF